MITFITIPEMPEVIDTPQQILQQDFQISTLGKKMLYRLKLNLALFISVIYQNKNGENITMASIY